MSYYRSPITESALSASANSNVLVLPTLSGSKTASGVLTKSKMHASHIHIPVGTIIAVVSSSVARSTTAFPGYLMCDGTSVSTTTYADLFAITGYGFGGSGASFSLPSLNSASVTLVGRDNMGGTAASRIDGGSNVEDSRGSFFGSTSASVSAPPVHTHTVTVTDSHSHTYNEASLVNTGGQANGNKANAYLWWGGSNATYQGTLESAGGGATATVPQWPSSGNTNSHENRQPFLPVQWMIRI